MRKSFQLLWIMFIQLCISGCSLETPTVEFSLTSQTVQESAGVASLDVALSTESSLAVRIPYSLSGTALGGGGPTDDYLGSDGVLTIPIGSKRASIEFPLITHVGTLPDRTLIVTLGDPENGLLGDRSEQTVTISNAGTTPTVVNATFPGPSAPSNCPIDDFVNIPFTLDFGQTASAILNFPLVVNATGGLTNGADYSVITSTSPAFFSPGVGVSSPALTIPNGGSGAFAVIAITNCAAVSGQTITISVTAPGGATVGPDSSVTVTFP